MQILKGVLPGAEAQVTVRVEPVGQRVPVSDKEPLADVELCLVDNHRSLWNHFDTSPFTLEMVSEGRNVC